MMKKFFAAAILSVTSIAPAYATTIIDFGNRPSTINLSNETFQEDGFQFSFGNRSFLVTSTNPHFGGFDSTVLELDQDPASLTRIGGGLFNFESVLVSQDTSTLPISFTGVFADNSTVVATLLASEASVVDASVQTFSGFTNIKELIISKGSNGFALYDDFTLSVGMSPVPLPASFPLILAGMGALWGLRRRNA